MSSETELTAQIAKLEKKLKKSETVCQETTREIWQLEARLVELEGKHRQALDTIAQLESQRPSSDVPASTDQELLARVEALTAEKSELSVTLGELRVLNSQLGHELENSLTRYATASERLAQLTAADPALASKLSIPQEPSAELVKLRQELSASEESLAAVQAQLRELQAEFEKHASSGGDQAGEVEQLRRQFSTLEAENQSNHSAWLEAQRECSRLQEETEQLEARVSESIGDYTRLQEEFDARTRDFSEQEKRLGELHRENAVLHERIHELEVELQQKGDSKTSLESMSGQQIQALQQTVVALESELALSGTRLADLAEESADRLACFEHLTLEKWEVEEQRQSLESQLRDLQEQMAANPGADTVEQLNQQLDEMRRQLVDHDELRQQVQQAHQRFEEMERELEEARGQIVQAAAIEELERRCQQLQLDFEGAQEQLGQMEALRIQIESGQERVRHLEEELEQAKALAVGPELAEAQHKSQQLTNELEVANGQLDELRAQMQQAEERFCELEQELQQAKASQGELGEAAQQYDTLRAELEQAKEQLQELEELRTQMQQAEERFAELEQQLAQAKSASQEISPLEEQNESLRAELDQAKEQLLELEELRSQMQQAEDRFAELEQELEQCKGSQGDQESFRAELERAKEHANELVELRSQMQQAEERFAEMERDLQEARAGAQEPPDDSHYESLRAELERAKEHASELEELRWRMQQSETRFAELERELEQAKSTAREYQNSGLQQEALLSELEQAQRHLDDLHEMRDGRQHAEERICELQFDLERARAHTEQHRQVCDELDASRQRCEELECQLASRSDVPESHQQQLQEALSQSQQLQEQLQDAQVTLREVRQSYQKLLAEREQLEMRLASASSVDSSEVNRLQSALEEQSRQICQLQAERLQLQGELDHRTVSSSVEVGQFVEQVSGLRRRLEEAEDERSLYREQAQKLKAENAALAASQGTGGDAGDLQLFKDKCEILQEKLERLQERYEIAEEKNQIYKEKLASRESATESATAELDQLRSRVAQLEREVVMAGESNASVRQRAADADRIFAAAEERQREAEEKIRESWKRVHEAETRANQAIVEAKKLADKMADLEKRAQEGDLETQRLAFQDPLTGLPNNNLLTQYIDFTVKQSVRYRRIGAMLLVDLDRFGVFNEAMGFKNGDELLRQVAERLKTAIRDTDSLGRRGEDEFVILLTEINVNTEGMTREVRTRSIREHVEIVAQRVHSVLAKPFTVQGQPFYVQASIGIAICPDDGETEAAIHECADTALYFAKESGRNRYQFFSTELRKQQERKLSMDNQLRLGLERGEFQLQYLPIIDLNKGKAMLKGVEALVRWNHRLEGMLSPQSFLPLAEESGAIIQIGHWVMRESCKHLKDWLNQGMRLFLSINLSKRELLQADIVDRIHKELVTNEILPDYLKIDIPEGFNTFNPDVMDRVVEDFGRRGIHIALDDFGVGYSSLSRINVDHTRILKIDRSIVSRCHEDRQCQTVAVAAISLANSLNLWSLAEGVENVNQARFLLKSGCSMAQGYYFSEPLSAAGVAELYRSKKVWKL